MTRSIKLKDIFGIVMKYSNSKQNNEAQIENEKRIYEYIMAQSGKIQELLYLRFIKNLTHEEVSLYWNIPRDEVVKLEDDFFRRSRQHFRNNYKANEKE